MTRIKIPIADTLDTTLKFDIVAKGKIISCNSKDPIYFDDIFSDTPMKPSKAAARETYL